MVLLVAVMSMLGATLTLPGIAGIVLTMGMAVDANVLIFSRIREELARGVSPQMAIHAGFERAFITILDSNLTTLIVAVILYAVGTGPVKGFAVTLVGRNPDFHVHRNHGDPRPDQSDLRWASREEVIYRGPSAMKTINFMGQAKLAVSISGLLILVSIGSLATRQLNWGLDFTGGTLVEVHYSTTVDLKDIRNTLETKGFAGAIVAGYGSDQDVLIRLPQGYSDQQGTALLGVLQESFTGDVEVRRTEFVGPQMGDELREQGGLAMLLSLFLVMLYVAFRFQFKFALGALSPWCMT